jgi:predicted Fe-S protein YdhL (DUF1289 family)
MVGTAGLRSAAAGRSMIEAAVPSPCVDICRLDAQGLCVGCRRTIDEITEWPRASEARRREILLGLERRTLTAAAQDPARTARD